MKGPSRIVLLKRWKEYLNDLKRVLSEIFPGCEFYIIGSAVSGQFHSGSDIDVLVICDKTPKMMDIVNAIMLMEDNGLPKIFQIHAGNRESLKRYARLGRVVPLDELASER